LQFEKEAKEERLREMRSENRMLGVWTSSNNFIDERDE